jgi:hypothetical protein
MVINNFTVNIISFPVTAGSIISATRPVAVLLLEPVLGYSINAANFTATAPLPNYVASVVFTQVESNIVCTITYIPSSVMPSQDVLVSVCASGYAEETGVTISGTGNLCNVTNTSIPIVGSADVYYSSSGELGSTAMVFNQAVTAASGYYFATEPFYAISVGNVNNYTITNQKSYNTEGQLIQIVFDIAYTFPSDSVSGDVLCLTAIGEEIYSPAVKIVSYTYGMPPNCLNQVGITSDYIISGVTGAAWNLTVIESDGTVIYNSGGVIDSTGSASIPITIPPVFSNKIYTFTLTGDLADTFTQNPPLQVPVFDVCQGNFVQLFFGTNSAAPCCNITEGTYALTGGTTLNTATEVLNPDQTRASVGYYTSLL